MNRPALDPTRWEQVQELFHALLEADPGSRAELLARAAQQDPALSEEARALLGAHEAPGLLGTLDPRPAAPAARIGPFRLGELVGTGGMGVVYAAEREGPDFTQRVALKLIRAGYADPRLEERLRHERRILARLEHPGIARFIDGGTTETGQSYFAMEFVEGESLLDYCKARTLGIRERLELFLEVCDAVHHAHQQRVVHGDLKPGNILVTASGRPKLLDFGIAELLEAGGADPGPRTTPWLTPAYASPEQVRSERLTTLADVYSLGVVLYELLVGRLPYPVLGQPPAEAAHVVQTREPVRPSSAVDDPARRRALAGDLDAILLTALAKEPARRYASVAELSADLRRHLAGEPVTARPPTPGYRLGRFVRRHRVLVGAAALVFVSLVGGITVAVWQAQVARRERDAAALAQQQAEAVTEFVVELFTSADPRQAGLDSVAARSLFVRGLAEVEGLRSQPLLQAHMLEALGRLQASFGDYRGALAMHRRALDLRRKARGPDDPVVALSYEQLALVHRRQGEITEAESLLALALPIARRAGPAGRMQLARTLLTAANVAVASARLDSAESYAIEAYALARNAPPGQKLLAAETIRVLASVLRRRGDVDRAEPRFAEYVDYAREHFGGNDAFTGMAMAHQADFLIEVRERPAQAESLYRLSLALQVRALGDSHPATIHARGGLAEVLLARGEAARAESLFLVNYRVVTRRVGRETGAGADALLGLSRVLRRTGRPNEAAARAEEALALYRRLRPDDPIISSALGSLAFARLEQGRGREALALATEALALRRAAYGDRHPITAAGHEHVARILARLGRRAEAEVSLRRARAILGGFVLADHPDLRRLERLLQDSALGAHLPLEP
jgi:tetratricopeptide (TPR) repeat protein